MCGIVGVVGRGDRVALRDSLSNALRRIEHRGPDDSGIWSAPEADSTHSCVVHLGHVRLSILDLSSNGHQPMESRAGAVILFNGEIYNYRELKDELRGLGHFFESGTDTEVLLAAYLEWGAACVSRLVGMWAFAVWDGERLFLSRDRLGEKPLYYFHDPDSGLFAFASEIKALREFEPVPWWPNEAVVYRFLAFGDMERGDETFFGGIRQLPPATNMLITPGEKRPEFERFWSLPPVIADIDESEAVAAVAEALLDSVRYRLCSDVPLGLSLSGGLDSTLILAAMLELGVDCPPVFSSSYDEPGYSESSYVEIARSRLRCKPYSVSSDAEHFLRDFEKFVQDLGQPCKLPGPYSQWRVAGLAKDHVKVLIDGQGADELAGGYLYFLPQAWKEMASGKKLAHAGDLALTAFANRHVLKQYHPGLVWARLRGVAGDGRSSHLSSDWCKQFRDELPAWGQSAGSTLNEALRESLTLSSLPALLRYGDHLTMAFGVENRSPFLDHRLVELVARLPAELKIRGATTKWIFRSVARGRIPEAIRKRRMKMGFPTPVGVWIREVFPDVARRWLQEYAEVPLFARWIDVSSAESLLEAHIAGKAEHQAVLWRILNTGAWLRSAGFSSV